MPRRDRSIDALLDLDGQTIVVDDAGHVVRFAVRRAEPSENRPHGLSYFWAAVERTLKLDEE